MGLPGGCRAASAFCEAAAVALHQPRAKPPPTRLPDSPPSFGHPNSPISHAGGCRNASTIYHVSQATMRHPRRAAASFHNQKGHERTAQDPPKDPSTWSSNNSGQWGGGGCRQIHLRCPDVQLSTGSSGTQDTRNMEAPLRAVQKEEGPQMVGLFHAAPQ
ncbi:uncharacterized protein PHA67_002582 isoform 1-T1 [Liasis olivaceus]